MRSRHRGFLTMVGLLLTVSTPPAGAQWAPDGSPVSTAPNDQLQPVIVADGTGGAIVVWSDSRVAPFDFDIYAQRIDAAAFPRWTVNGLPVVTIGGDQTGPAVVADGQGGAIITWEDSRPGATAADIYAQRVNSDGTLLWATDGVPVCVAAGSQFDPTIVSDGQGGAIIAWEDHRTGSGPFTADIYAQRIDADGIARWTLDGVPISIDPEDQFSVVAASDGAGGAILAWSDSRGFDFQIFGQRVTAAGATRWTANGIAVAPSLEAQFAPVICSDGAGGAIVAWEDERNSTLFDTEIDVFAQRLDSLGAALWGSSGVAVSDASGDQITPVVAADGSSGVVVAWRDQRADVGDIYAMRMSAAGAALWTLDGVAACAAIGGQRRPAIVSDGAGGAIVSWDDARSSFFNANIYAQRMDASGLVRWSADGVAVCAAGADQVIPTMAPDRAGGAFLAWEDARSGVDADIYAQRVTADGIAGPVVSVPGSSVARFQMLPPRPNPTRSAATFVFALPSAERVSAAVYDIGGRVVRVLARGEEFSPGLQTLSWDGRDASGVPMAGGIYLLRLRAGLDASMVKLTLLR